MKSVYAPRNPGAMLWHLHRVKNMSHAIQLSGRQDIEVLSVQGFFRDKYYIKLKDISINGNNPTEHAKQQAERINGVHRLRQPVYIYPFMQLLNFIVIVIIMLLVDSKLTPATGAILAIDLFLMTCGAILTLCLQGYMDEEPWRKHQELCRTCKAYAAHKSEITGRGRT